jgi:hypothetical protein
MSNYPNITDFSTGGLNIGKDQKVLAYLHGLSDFWVFMFEDASKINLLMEANAVRASDVYNKFLQLSSVISLEGISTLTNSQTKLILIKDSDLVANKVEVYKLPTDEPLKYARHLANRAFLPTTLLDNEADYYLDETLGEISFAKPLRDLGFPFRTLSDGTKEYAMWAIDAKIDDNLIYEHYGKLINVNPTASTDLFKNFVYGMYYLFVNGPHMDTVRRGLNIALGIPLARDVESVLEIRKYLNTDQWLVVTDLNSYLVPYGLEPTVAVDDLLSVGEEIAQWIEVKDYQNDGEWWINFMLPSHLMPHIPPSVPGGGGVSADASPDRYMTAGSYADWLMRNYLKTHTFLVNVKTVGFKNIQSFEQLAKIIREVKPSYTTPIYVWTVPIDDDIIEFSEGLQFDYNANWCEEVTDGIGRFWRGNTTDPQIRDCCPVFVRMSAPAKLDDITGYTEELNGYERTFQEGTVTGFIAPQQSYNGLDDSQKAWLTTLRSRGQEQYIPRKGLLDFGRDTAQTGAGVGVHPFADKYPDYRLVALHTTTITDVKEKFASVNITMPDEYMISLFQPTYTMDAINEHPVDDSYENSFYDFLVANYAYYFNKGVHGRYLGQLFPEDSYITFTPDISQLRSGDFLVFTRITNNVYGVYWATKNFDLETTPYFRHEEPDTLGMTISGKVTRGMAPSGSPYYQLRSANFTIGYNTGNEIDGKPVNDPLDDSTTLSRIYEDDYNAPFQMDRSGRALVTQRNWK